jgi:hypothetical protein
MITSYHTPAEITAILTAMVPSRDTVRAAWEAVPAEERAGLVLLAQQDLDACAWVGQRASASQIAAWPRRPRVVRRNSDTDSAAWSTSAYRTPAEAGIEIESPLPVGVEAWSVAGIPANLRLAHAIQCGHHAAVLMGADAGSQARLDDARRGIVSAAGGGQSYSIDAARADRPRNQLHPKARALVAQWLAHSAEGV